MPAEHEDLSWPEFAALLGFRNTAQAHDWVAHHIVDLGIRPRARRIPRTVLELARGMREGDSGYHASAKLEAYLKEHR